MSSEKTLLIALNTKPWTWFRDGKKTWELRIQKRQFNENNWRIGRPVNLRRGYSTPDNLFGNIAEVKIFNNLDTALAIIGHLVIPLDVAPDLNSQRKLFIDMNYDATDDFNATDRFIACRPENLIWKNTLTGKETIITPDPIMPKGVDL